jgi:hypothetical protein
MAYRPDYESADYQEGYADGKAESVKEWQGLSDDEIDNIIAYPWGETKDWVRAIEQALKEKNAVI